ncbi:radical SAM protein [Corallococcus sp. H22C18031201]|uniref:radical SAM protein n=1 Tax=Citreicoccus inhibens TaxID=2849499 RepID=UPI000E7226B4|nr:radical SAM protein [Citreicoccus inhibens]MBU8899219.1 radical SAM protein [Citreicoccus inhibens]RJS25707.1 radical SAM protein [Corallococcus sp. H22C18031201]
MDTAFVAFVPLSNWLRGFDRYRMRYSKALISESTFPGAFYMLKEDEPWAPGLDKARRLVAKLGRAKDRVVALRARLPTSGAQAMRRNDVTGTGIGWHWPAPEVPLSGVAWVSDDGTLRPTIHEEVTAQAFLLDDAGLTPWARCRPRSFSVLPVARACQARCAFCFSKASVSDLARQRSASLEVQLAWADLARTRGAERAVITGGGEPTLLAPSQLRALVRGLAERYPKTLLITNGARLDAEQVRALRDEGLTTLALSRHGVTREDDARIMGLSIDSGPLASTPGLRTRAICVLQRGGVEDVSKVHAYLDRSAREGFHEVCFKELYVSSLSESAWAPSAVNQFCAANQVPLEVVLRALDAAGFRKVAELPWGSPVFEGEVAGRALRVAAYTEPSVGWERTNGRVRSWNLMTDGTCLASLEDPASELHR